MMGLAPSTGPFVPCCTAMLWLTPEELGISIVAGPAGVVLSVVGHGPTMRQARATAYGRLKNIVIPSMYYRDDIGDRWVEDSDRLHNWGYLRES